MTAEGEVRRRIREKGAIAFAEFMEVALYWPEGGYYLQGEPIGATGDYYTSPLVHPAFGSLLAVQFYQMWQLLDCPNPFTVVEAGAGNGLLCRDIITFSAHLPRPFRDSLSYICVDRRDIQGLEWELSDLEGNPVRSRIVASGIPFRGLRGCVFSNELLDAFPVHQVKMQRDELQEVYITLAGDSQIETLREPSTPKLQARLDELGVQLSEHQAVEINLGLSTWVEDVAKSLDAGFVVTVDYGDRSEQLYSNEQRPRGTLTTFHQHLQTDAPLRHIGEQDITAQVDFSALVRSGRAMGLEPTGFALQRDFLNNLGLSDLQRRLPPSRLAEPQVSANRAGMVDLARPGSLGDFKVLIQSKNVSEPKLWGFQGGAEARDMVAELPIPLLTSQHLSLLEGRYPQQELEFEIQDLWDFGDGVEDERM